MKIMHITLTAISICAGASGFTSEKAKEAPVVPTTEDLVLAKQADYGPGAEKELAVARKEVFEFTRSPSITKVEGDNTTIEFAVKDFCDATVAVEDANGRLVRHVASGVLGANAPAPFKRNALEQSIIWDGKNDAGRYVDDKSGLSIRVSLGLQAKLERVYHQSPYSRLGEWPVVATGPGGVYLFEDNMCDYLRQYDHDGKFVQSIVPFRADRLEKVNGLAWFTPPAGEKMPFKAGNNNCSLLPMANGLFDNGTSNPAAACIAVYKDKIALPARPRLLRLSTDGTSGGVALAGPKIPEHFKHAAFSPDGKWLYLARRCHKSGRFEFEWWNGIWRMPYEGVQEPQLFIGRGEPSQVYKSYEKSGKEPDDFRYAASVSVDAQGRIYVADWMNDRVQVFMPDGKPFKALKVRGAADVSVDPNSGEIYVSGWQMTGKYGDNVFNSRSGPPMIHKFGPIENPTLIWEGPLPASVTGHFSQVTVDFWSKPKRIWTVDSQQAIRVFDEKDGRMQLKLDFDQEARKTLARSRVPHFQRQFLFFDPRRQVLYLGETDVNEAKYFSTLIEIDIQTGKEKLVKLPFEAADAAFDPDGLIYLLNDKYVARFEPATWREVPFDYGEEHLRQRSVIATTGGHTSSYKHFALGVSPQREVIVAGAGKFAKTTRGESLAESTKGWVPQWYPGRPAEAVYIHVYDKHGEIEHEDVLKGIGLINGGLGLDNAGNIYAVVRQNRKYNGHAYGENAGALIKANPDTCLFLADHKPLVALPDPPKRPKEVSSLWIEGVQWIYGGSSVGALDHCFCRHGRFALDYFARVFVPENFRYSVAVLDTAGNVILRIGRYGNAESAGPNSAVPLGGDEVGLCDAHFLAVQSDKRLFIADTGNARILSVTLDYHVSKSLKLK